MTDDIHSLKTETALLKQEIATNKDMLNKLAATTDKIGEVASYVAKILAVHDARLNTQEEEHRQVQNELKDVNTKLIQVKSELAEDLERTEERITKAITEIKEAVSSALKTVSEANTEKNKELDQRLRTLENWRWVLVGGGVVIGVLLGKLPLVAQLLHGLGN